MITLTVWKRIEISAITKFHKDVHILWKSHAPEIVLNALHNTQLADSIRTWYVFRENATKEMFDVKFSEIGGCQSLWFNRNARSKSKQYLYYGDWYEKQVYCVSDLLNPPLPGSRLFEEMVGISDRGI